MRATPLDRFEEKYVTDEVTGCMIWTASGSGNGYGKMRVDGRMVMAHRFAYEHFHGPIPDGMVINHLCRNRACVNPCHLEVVTRYENTMHPDSLSPSKLNAEKSHCVNGHEFTPENTYTYRRGSSRKCRICVAEETRRRRQRKRQSL